MEFGFDQGDAVIIYHLSKAIGTCVHSETSEKKKSSQRQIVTILQ